MRDAHLDRQLRIAEYIRRNRRILIMQQQQARERRIVILLTTGILLALFLTYVFLGMTR